MNETVSKMENVGDGDAISRRAAIDKVKERLIETALNNVGIMQNVDEVLVDVAEERLENWLDEVPSAQTELEDKIRAIGYTGKEGRIYIGGRLFAVRELAQ